MALRRFGVAGLILVLIVVLPFAVLIYASFVTYVHVPGPKLGSC
jgi:hypothetical protein